MLITLIATVVIGSIIFVRCNSGTAANASGNDAAITKKASDPITGINVIEFKVNGQPVKTSGMEYQPLWVQRQFSRMAEYHDQYAR